MAIIKTQAFRRTAPILTSGDRFAVDQMVTDVETECNAFLATVPALNVLDVRKIVTTVGKDDILTHVDMWVVYRE